MDYKQSIFLIFKEGINNAIKHSKYNKIVLEANLNKDIFELTLHNDGAGFDIQKIKTETDFLTCDLTLRQLAENL